VALLGNCDTDEKESRGKRVVPEQFLAAGASSRAGDTYHSFRANGPHMPVDYVGLSYEVQQLLGPAFFSRHYVGLIREFKALSGPGVLRLVCAF
jgi:hypothetical protein